MACVFRVLWMAGLVSLVVLAGLAGAGSSAVAQDDAGCGGGVGLVAADESAALALAVRCGVPVEIELARGFTQRQFAEPDGTVTLESYLRPQWAYDRSGAWVEVDPTLVADPESGIATVAAVVDVEVSPGGDGPFVTATDPSGASLTLSWPESLPEPVLAGATATYPGVYEGVDLQVTAGVDGFSYALVVHSAAAAEQVDSVAVQVESEQLAVSQFLDGPVTAVDSGGGVVFSAGSAYMWDSSSPEPAGAGLAKVALAGDSVRVTPDAAMRSDSELAFPVTVGSAFTASRPWTVVASGQQADDEFLRVGYDRSTDGVWRSTAQFDTTALRGVRVNSAQMTLAVSSTSSCASALDLWRVRSTGQGAAPVSWGSHLDSGVCQDTGGGEVGFGGDELGLELQRHADSSYESITFGLRTPDESATAGSIAMPASSLVLIVNLTPVTAVPSGLTTDGVGCLAPVGSRVAGAAPVLAGVPRHSEGTARGRFEVRTASGSANLVSWLSEPGPSGGQVSWQVAEVLPDGVYRWRMRSEHPDDPATTSGWSGWCQFTVDAALGAEPEPEAAEGVECPVAVPPVGELLTANDESIGLLLAQACEVAVEVLSERDFGTRVLAQPAGTLVAEQYTEPQWAYDGEGEWTEVDPSFEVAGDGTVATAAAVSQIEVSAGGTGPLLTATDPGGGSVSLSWPVPLPAPVVDGATVTYPEVLPDVDLQVAAGVDGFSYVLVVKSAAGAANPELASVGVGIDTGGGLSVVQDADGGVVVQDASGEAVFSSPAAYMWDSSEPAEPPAVLVEDEGSGDPGDVPPGQFTQMPLELAGGTLTVEPDQGLLSDPATEFPVLIDPPFSGRRLHWASVHQQQPSRGWTDDSKWPREGGMRVGNLQWWPGYPCGDACGLWRSAIRFDIKSLGGRQVVSAKVKAVQTHTSGCGAYGLQLWYVTAFTSGTSWNGLSDNWENRLETQTVDSSNRTGGCDQSQAYGVTFDSSAVRGRVQSHADAGHGSLSFGFRSSDEVAKQAYRRIAVKSVKLEVEYNRPAQVPTTLKTDGISCDFASPGPWVTTQRPTLSGKPRDPDGRTGAHLQIRKTSSSSTHYAWQSAINRAHNKVVNHRIPSDKKLSSGNYRWRMRSLDSHPQGTHSDWRQWCYFRVDVTSPTTPKVEIVGEEPTAGQPVTLRFTSSDAHSGLAGFWYGVNEEVKRASKSSSGTTTITFTTPSSGGRNWIYVWSRDKAGNYSNRAVFDFFSARLVEATPVAAWRLDGDGLDDSGQGHELMLGNGVAWEADAGPPADRSLGFDGTGCVSTEGPVVRTDAEYTVAAWVRLDSIAGPYAVLAPAGQVRPGFTLRYNTDENRWIFVLGDRDAQETTFATLRSAGAPVVGAWTHLAVRVDPAARHMQMYVNGQLSGEREIPFVPWNAAGPMYVGCSGPVTGGTWGHFDGAIRHVGVWQGLLTPAQIQAVYAGELPAGLTGDWRLRANGADASPHARDITVPTTAVSWVDDQYGRQRSAMRLNGTDGSWAESTGPIARTDQSFSIAAWAKLDNKDDFRTIASQGGTFVTAFNLNYQPFADRWQLSMSSHDDEDLSTVVWHIARSTSAPVTGEWYHLVGVYDRATNQLRLYVNGALQSTATGPAQPWRAPGPLLVGTGGNTSGERSNRMIGTISDVATYRGALTDGQAASLYGNPAVRSLSRWELDGTGTDQVGGHGLTLVGTEGVDYDWFEDRFCFPWTALGLQMSGQAHARTSGPVVVTDESFTVTAWVSLDSMDGGYQTVISQGGGNRPAMHLQVTPDGGWRFAMPQADAISTTLAAAQSPAGVAEVGVWTHLAGVFDQARGEVRLYVDGEMVDVDDTVESPWQATGPFYVGAAGLAGGGASELVHGSIDAAAAWSSTLDPDRIAQLAAPSPFGPCF
jgi:hypothetical protein